jgi:hypothetical protein
VKIQGYLVLVPGADRPYFSHLYPSWYKRDPGAKVYSFELTVPTFEMVDGRIEATANEVQTDVSNERGTGISSRTP